MKIQRTKDLYIYMKARAKHEKVAFELDGGFFESHFKQGIRSFFGVQLDQRGRLIRDFHQPAFFEHYVNPKRNISLGDGAGI